MKRLLLPLLLVTSLLSLAFLIEDDTWQNKVHPSILTATQNGQTVEFLIVMEEQTSVSTTKKQTKNEKGTIVFQQLQQTAQKSQQAVASILDAVGANYKAFYIVNMLYTKGDISLIESIANRPEVRAIQPNPTAKVERSMVANINQIDTRDPDEVTWGIDMINADEVWAMGITGEGVIVGGQDTGYEWEHPALKAKYRGWDGSTADHNYNWHDSIDELNPLNNDNNGDPGTNPCGLSSPFPCDDNSHGTHTMGTMIGSDGAEEIGVAPNAKWIACRNMDRGWGSLATYVECFEFFLAPTDLNGDNPDPTKAPHVINNSWGCPEIEGCNSSNFEIMEAAIDNLKSAGVVVVVSAGNNGDNCSTVYNPAAIFENSFTIGSTRMDDVISNFSSRGPVTVDGSNRLKPNVSAPGQNVRSAVLNGEYGNKSGTSMAGPHVAGVVALMIAANPALAGDVETIETILEETAIDKMASQECGGLTGDNIPNNTYGHGRIDALAAVEAALELVDTQEEFVQELRIYPNPFTDEISLEMPTISGTIIVDIFNVNGQIVYQNNWINNTSETKQISLPQLPKGAYFYKVQYEGGTVEGKIVKL